MVSILPNARNPWDVISSAIGQNINQNLPQAVQKGFERQQGLNAIEQLQNELQNANGDFTQMLPALARAYTLNPSLERSGLGQTFLQQSKLNRAFGPSSTNAVPSISPNSQNSVMEPISKNDQELNLNQPRSQVDNISTPSPFNILTAPEINQQAEDYARAVNDPNAYQVRQAQLANQNQIAENQRAKLEDTALKAGIKADELPQFMIAGSKFDPRNPSEWLNNTNREFAKVKNFFNSLQKAFIPGVGSALLGRDREKTLNRLDKPVQNLIKNGYEKEVREFLADNYLSPTEIEERIHPLSKEKIQALDKLPSGFFPKETKETTTKRGFTERVKSPFISYEEALEKAPREMEVMQKRLTNFLKDNVDQDTSLLVLRDKLVNKDYDWRQFGPALAQAQEEGLKLSPNQLAEITSLEQPPLQSLPDIFQSFDRVLQFIRGNK